MSNSNQEKELLLELTKHLEYALLELWELQKDKISSEEYGNTYGYLIALAKKADDYLMSFHDDEQLRQEALVSEDGNTCTYNSVKYEKYDTGFSDCYLCIGNSGKIPCKVLPDCGKYIWVKAK